MSNFFELQIQEIRRPEVSYRIQVRWFTTIREVKDKLHMITKYPIPNMQLFHASSSIVLSNKTTLRELGMVGDAPVGSAMLMLSFQVSTCGETLIQPISGISIDTNCKELIRQVRLGFSNGCGPSKTHVLDCTGGVYFLRSPNGTIAAVFKPRDEEQGMPNNPKGYAGDGNTGLRAHFKPGKNFIREVAAYLMDHDGVCGVPPTTIVHCEHPSFNYPRKNSIQKTFPKLGSLQKFVRATDIFENVGVGMISNFELQKIALLDMRILNCDRNSTNILLLRKAGDIDSSRSKRHSRSGSLASLTEDSSDELDMEFFLSDESMVARKGGENDLYELIPIDHGYCFPSKLLIDEFDWVWFDAPQIQKAVHPDLVKYINDLDIEQLIANVTRQISIPQESLFLIRVVHYLLVKGISLGLTLRDIAELIVRTDDGVPSALEKVIADCEDNAYRAMEVRNSHSYHNSKQSFLDVSFPRLLNSPPAANSMTAASINTRKDTDTDSNQLRGLRLDCLDTMSKTGNQSINTFSSFQSSDSVFATRTISELSSPTADYFMQDLDDPTSPLRYRNTLKQRAGLKDFRYSPLENEMKTGSDFISHKTKTSLLNAEEPQFSTLEVETTELINFEKQAKSNNRDRAFSCYTSEEEIDSGGESLACSPSDCSMLDYFKSGLQGLPLSSVPRVVSFGAFESPSLYDIDEADRQFLRLRKEKRKLMAKTPGFRKLTLNFAAEIVDKVVQRKLREKLSRGSK